METPKGPMEEHQIAAQQGFSRIVRKIAFRRDYFFLRQRWCDGIKKPQSLETEVTMVCDP